MSLLARYIFQRHARLLLLIMSLGLGLYLLTEIVERVDIFIDNGAGMDLVLKYFACRLPGIVAQILPAVFLLATVVVLCIMGHSRELTALQAGGISFVRVAMTLVMCGAFWGGLQFACSQFIGVQGDRLATQIWQEQVRKRDMSAKHIKDVWFTEKGWTISVNTLRVNGSGKGFSAFHVKEGTASDIDVIVRAPRVKATEKSWTAYNAECFYPESFKREEQKEVVIPVQQDPALFFATSSVSLQQLPIWQRGEAIELLGEAGSNVEGLRTVWHGKIAYAASLMVMALLGVAIVSWNSNIYIAVGISMAGTFILYALTMFGESLGQMGSLPPLMAAWFPDALLLSIALARLYFVSVRR